MLQRAADVCFKWHSKVIRCKYLCGLKQRALLMHSLQGTCSTPLNQLDKFFFFFFYRIKLRMEKTGGGVSCPDKGREELTSGL